MWDVGICRRGRRRRSSKGTAVRRRSRGSIEGGGISNPRNRNGGTGGCASAGPDRGCPKRDGKLSLRESILQGENATSGTRVKWTRVLQVEIGIARAGPRDKIAGQRHYDS